MTKAKHCEGDHWDGLTGLLLEIFNTCQAQKKLLVRLHLGDPSSICLF